ncbi:MAG: hypothetical protein M3268_07330 [Acidobacteriota bacterium]|nr:hypothetical protein [Acidobacteriota bacterium]
MRRPLASILFAACLPFALCALTVAQQPQPAKLPPHPLPDATAHSRDDDDGQSSPTEEMLKSIELRRSEETYKENLERARETAQLGADVRDTFKRQKSLAADDLKKLARIEKLARSIRNDAGGGDDDSKIDDPPSNLGAAIERLADLCEDFRKKVEKTPRNVVSASVINSANRLIELTRLIKTLGG